MKNKVKSLSAVLLLLPVLLFAQEINVASDSFSVTKKGYGRYYTPIGDKKLFSTKQIHKKQLLVQVGINCHSMIEHGLDPCKVKEWSVLLISAGEVFYQGTQIGPFFSHEMIKAFKKLTAGDLIVVYNIKISNSIGTQMAPSFVYDVLE